ncbi:DUF6788 family protein [candidate division CSSED10-310 bacterium]|uniref:DUF6788 family protein n=1 Tax=candidate division CSSED10-310 bacterium TaxID=2855610 RepID=A0ABV6Z152_UNCC1
MARKKQTSEQGKDILACVRKIRPFIIGSLNITHKKCGSPTCRCATKGELHETSFLTWKVDKKTHSLYVPKHMRNEVKKWIEEGKKLKRLIKEMSEAQKEFLKSKRKNK